jgi:hypothetical protein
MDDGSEEEDKSEDEDGSEEEDKSEEESDDEESSSSIPQLAEKESPKFKLDKKTKVITYISSSWGGCRAKKPCTKYEVQFVSGCGSFMIGWCLLDKYNPNGSNYSNGHSWYATSSGLYGSSFKNGSTSFASAGSASNGKKLGTTYDPKKGTHNLIINLGIIAFYNEGKYVADGFENLKKLKLYPIIDIYETNSSFKFIKPKLKK